MRLCLKHCSNCWLSTLAGFILKLQTLLKVRPGIMRYVVVFSAGTKFINKKFVSLYCHSSTVKSVRKSLLQTLILATKMQLTFKMTGHIFIFLQILVDVRLIRFLLINHYCLKHVELSLTTSGCYAQMPGLSVILMTNSSQMSWK